MDEKFLTNLLRMLAAEAHFNNCLVASREMFGRSYFSLGIPERAAVDQAVLAHVGGNYTAITAEYLEAQQTRPSMGFPIQGEAPTQGS